MSSFQGRIFADLLLETAAENKNPITKQNTHLSIIYNGCSSASLSFSGPLLFRSTETGFKPGAFQDGLTENSALKSGRRVNRKVNKVEKGKQQGKRKKNSRKNLCSPKKSTPLSRQLSRDYLKLLCVVSLVSLISA